MISKFEPRSNDAEHPAHGSLWAVVRGSLRRATLVATAQISVLATSCVLVMAGAVGAFAALWNAPAWSGALTVGVLGFVGLAVAGARSRGRTGRDARRTPGIEGAIAEQTAEAEDPLSELVDRGIESARRFAPRPFIRAHVWSSLGGALAAGFLTAWSSGRRTPKPPSDVRPGRDATIAAASSRRDAAPERPASSSEKISFARAATAISRLIVERCLLNARQLETETRPERNGTAPAHRVVDQ